MSLAAVLRSLPATVRLHEGTYRRTRAEEPAFARYASAGEMLEALSPESDLTVHERQPIVQALLRRHLSSRHPLWQALLLRTFEPVLKRLRAQVDGWEDRDERVLVAFFEALRRKHLATGPVFITVPRATARALFAAADDGQELPESLSFDELAPACAPPLHTEPHAFVACLAGEIVERLACKPGGRQLVPVLAGVETAEEHAARQPGERPARVRQRKRRLLAEVRASLGCTRPAPSKNRSRS